MRMQLWMNKSDANLRSWSHANLRFWSHVNYIGQHAVFWSLCLVMLLAMAFVGPLEKMRGTKRKVVCVLRQADDSSEEDVWDKEKETFRVYEARVDTTLPGEPKQSWPRSDFQRSSQPLMLQRCG